MPSLAALMASGSGLSGRTGSAAAAVIGNTPSSRTSDETSARSLDMTLPFRPRCLYLVGAHAPHAHTANPERPRDLGVAERVWG